MTTKKTQVVCLDFDGVLADYRGVFQLHGLPPPLEGARTAAHILAKTYKLVCLTSRTNVNDVNRWLTQHGFPPMRVTNIKLPAHVYIDDRGITFPGQWTDQFLGQIKSFAPHWKQSESQDEQVSS